MKIDWKSRLVHLVKQTWTQLQFASNLVGNLPLDWCQARKISAWGPLLKELISIGEQRRQKELEWASKWKLHLSHAYIINVTTTVEWGSLKQIILLVPITPPFNLLACHYSKVRIFFLISAFSWHLYLSWHLYMCCHNVHIVSWKKSATSQCTWPQIILDDLQYD